MKWKDRIRRVLFFAFFCAGPQTTTQLLFIGQIYLLKIMKIVSESVLFYYAEIRHSSTYHSPDFDFAVDRIKSTFQILPHNNHNTSAQRAVHQ